MLSLLCQAHEHVLQRCLGNRKLLDAQSVPRGLQALEQRRQIQPLPCRTAPGTLTSGPDLTREQHQFQNITGSRPLANKLHPVPTFSCHNSGILGLNQATFEWVQGSVCNPAIIVLLTSRGRLYAADVSVA